MYLFGASGHAKVIIDILLSEGIAVLGLYDEDESKKELMGIPVLGKTIDFNQERGHCIVSIGDNKTRSKVVNLIKEKARFGTAIHQQSTIGSQVYIQEGSVVMPGVIINADTKIGKHAIINTSSSVDHDCLVEDFVHIAPNSSICGGVKIGEGTLFGAGATAIPLVSIGKWCVIGAGAVITEDVPDYSVVVGNPGKIIKTRQP
ncbi:acetyltransferase [Marivirga lumbricoides]|uniref:Acetyltransferase n=1 Tax=Marivirga lumbricoides TaxID=1046115 RepID=A0A2T4DPZ8_9BACT|nr:acetyltransferase [Marivirga lumbricoides]